MAKLWRSALLTGLLMLAIGVRAEDPAPEAAAPQSAPAAGEGDVAAEYDLMYKFTPGETLRTEVLHQAKVQTTVQGTTQTAETKSTSIKVWKVEHVADDGTATFSHMVENIDMWQRTTGRKEVRYNSRQDKEVPPGYEHVADAVGVPLSIVTMNPRGKIIKRKEAREQPTATSTQMTMPLPSRPIVIGTSWSSPLEIDVTTKDGGVKKIETRQKFTLEAVDDEFATIKVDSQVLTPVSDPSIEAQLIQRLSHGTVKFDIKAGRVVSQQLDLDRHVIGFSGPASSMHYVTRFSEKLLPPDEKTARRTAPPANTSDDKAEKPSTAPAR